jgi:hypothetical protein
VWNLEPELARAVMIYKEFKAAKMLELLWLRHLERSGCQRRSNVGRWKSGSHYRTTVVKT